MAETSSSPAAPPKPVVVRVKRKPSQSPLDALWLEINDRPLKRSLLDFGNLSLSHSSQNVECLNKKVFVQHVETISSSLVTLDIVQSFVEPGSASESKPKVEERKNFFKKVNKQDQLLSKAKQEKESSAKDARFEQIWKSRKEKGTTDVNALLEICQFYDIVRVDEEKIKEVPQEDISLEDQKLLSSYLPLLREVIPNAAVEIEADISSHAKQEDYVYDLYTVTTDEMIVEEDSSYSYPVIQVEDEDFYDGPDDSDYDTDDSNAEGNIKNDYPDEISEDEGSESESEKSKDGRSSNESSKDEEDEEDEDDEHHGYANGDTSDPCYDEDFDHYEGQGADIDEDEHDDLDNEHAWRWSYR
ncbi:hypothetical protein TSUD_165540 [Trifolium subterraneum]|uniref:Transcription factor Iwr1 domain-containing protein n=1 Tax=Trifolium subterraneum TaxID=3900 RepID=A0A2Z6M9G4_TRISU|nr:hypothetical protein TSUD_165540 [Trifolium subterraneum]